MVGDGGPGDALEGAPKFVARQRHAPLPDVLADVVQNFLLPFGEFLALHSRSVGVGSASRYGVQPYRFELSGGGYDPCWSLPRR